MLKSIIFLVCLYQAIAQSQFDFPVVDVSNFTLQSDSEKDIVAQKVDDAFRDFGFVIITGHGVSEKVFEAAHASAKHFFHQPIEIKREYDLGLGYGYGGYLNDGENGGQLSGQSYDSNQSDHVESLTCRGLQHLKSNMATFEPIFAQDMSSVPYADMLPTKMRREIISLHQEFLPLKKIMTEITEMSLRAKPGEFWKYFVPEKGGVRFAYYPEIPEEAFIIQSKLENSVVGYGAHADSGSMVFLRLDHENPVGTEVWHQGKWVPVPAIPNGVVVNLGTVLSRLTGGRWQAAVHRATRRNHLERLSIVYGAMVPQNNLILRDLSSSEEGHAITVKQYLDARVRLQRPDAKMDDKEIVELIDHLTEENIEKSEL